MTPADEAAVLRALRSSHLTQGPEVEAFEAELAALSGAKYAVAVNSGTAALYLAYGAANWDDGLSVAVPAISFVATANALVMLHGSPWFQDCNDDDGLWVECGSPRAREVFVALGGQMGDLWGDRNIVDACHGPILHHWRALATCLSFHPAKHVAAGEGGAILTDDEGFAEECRLRRSHGRRGTEMVALGFNFRMPEVCAALARSQLTRYHENVALRRRKAAVYDAAFAGHPHIQPVPHSADSARHLYQVLLPPERRDTIQAGLKGCGIGTAIHYPVIPLQPYYRERYGYRPGQFPGAEAHAARTLSLPLYPTLTITDQRHVIDKLLEAFG